LFKEGFYVPTVIPPEDIRSFDNYPSPRTELGEKPAIIVVDMVRAFVENRQPFGFGRTGAPCARAIRRLLDVARPLKVPVFYTTIGISSREIEYLVPEGSRKPKAFRNLDRESNEIVEELAPRAGEIVLEKTGPSGFFATPLTALLNRIRVDTLIVTGMVTSGCVRATAVDAFAYEFGAIVPVECVADRSQISHEVSLFDLSMKYARVVRLSELVRELRGGKSASP
jgi:maleamate amidohydrolase